jgi:hypothetical protein
MMGAETIRAMSREAARESLSEGKLPFVVWQQDLDDWKAVVLAGKLPRLPFPALGDRKPRGFKLVEEHFVDSSGMGSPREPADTIGYFIFGKIKVGHAYSLGDQGQFQVYVNEWKPSVRMIEKDKEERS